MNSKQVVAAVSVVILLVILNYPALATGTVSVALHSSKIEEADHVFLTLDSVWVHMKGESSTAGWKSIRNQSQQVDLVAIESSSQSLATGQMPVGAYDSVRLVVSNVTWIYNGTTANLTLASHNLESSIDLTLVTGKDVSISILLGASQQSVGTSRFFATNLNATISQIP
jgi:hypothetical protein